MDNDLKKILSKTADTIRGLSFEAVQKANSGHPGLPMGCAEIGAYLYGCFLEHNPKNTQWLGRDRFVLSAGHGSMLLYSCLHLAGFDVSLEDIKNFRQLHSKTPGHPEYRDTPGVETTTGPLGQGVGVAVGQALGLKLLNTKFASGDFSPFNGKVVCLAGDGCLMEGISSEASSFAGHLKLDNFILIHDANKVTLDGPLSQSSSEDVAMRYKAYGFDVYEMNGNDLEDVEKVFTAVRKNQKKPVFITAHTVIGKGSPNKAGTYKVHGSPLGPEECEATKKALGLPAEDFYVPQAVYTFFENREEKCKELEDKWNQKFHMWAKQHPDLHAEFQSMHARKIPQKLIEEVKALDIKNPIAGRAAAQAILEVLGNHLPYLYGGSADLSGSDCTMMKQFPLVEPGTFLGRNIKYGIREFGMATMAAGLYQTGMIVPYIGTFLTFSDYMRNAIRLSALSHYHVIYQFTHDSIFLGEDGPTHQPIEQFASLRTIPHLHVFRPADAWEVKGSWLCALQYEGPSAIILTRQNLRSLELDTEHSCEEMVGKGAYIIRKEEKKPDITLFATGSEVSLACDVASSLEKMDKSVRVVSMPCWELFEKQSDTYKESIVGGDLGLRVSIEAGVAFGWSKWIGMDGLSICMEGFGASAPQRELAEYFGFTVDSIIERILGH